MKTFQPSFRTAYLMILAWTMPMGAAIIMVDGGFTKCTFICGPIALAGGAAVGALLTKLAVVIFRVQVGSRGMILQDTWGFHHEIEWSDITDVRSINMMGFRYLRIYSNVTRRTLWLPSFLTDWEQFRFIRLMRIENDVAPGF